jgi:hypothetical protein
MVAGNASLFGLGRMFEIYRDLSGVGEQIQIFNDCDSALKWLFPSG